MGQKEVQVGNSVLRLIQGDITLQETDAIVNAANKQLAPGGGVAGAVHRAAGPGLWNECKELGGCETGEARITDGYNLKAAKVIHTVGPVYSGSPYDAELLQSCFENSLKLAVEHGLQSISFPAISTGIFGYPVGEAAEVSLNAIIGFLNGYPEELTVQFVLFSDSDSAIFQEKLQNILR